jgi:hypothetical protein
MRSMITTLLEIGGAASITIGTFLVSVPAGLIVAGAAAILFGYMAGDE